MVSSTPLTFRMADPDRRSDLEALGRWASDASIRHFYQVQRADSEPCWDNRQGAIQARLRQVYGQGREVYLMHINDRPVGSVSLAIDVDELSRRHNHEPTAWFGLVVGERDARGHGLGRRAMSFIEERAQCLGAKHAEVGIFQFNRGAMRFYDSLGYLAFVCHLNTTWWHGRYWGDIRMKKNLTTH